MTTHITNELTAPKHVLDSLAGPDGAVDFNTVVLMPDVVRATFDTDLATEDWARVAVGTITLASLSAATPDPLAAFKAGDYGAASQRLHQSNVIRQLQTGPFPKDYDDEKFEKLIACMRCLKATGHVGWYEWSLEHWGTKWNAYEVTRISDTVVRFQTAWSMPKAVIAALSEKFPAAVLRLRWADEDFGNNVGDIMIAYEGITGGPLADGSHEAKELALELCYGGVVPEEMKRNEAGELCYVEE